MAENTAIAAEVPASVPAAAPPKSGKKQKKEKKRKGKLFTAIRFILILAIIAAVTLTAYFDLWGLRTNLLVSLQLQKPAEQAGEAPSPQQSIIADEQKRLSAQKFEQDVRQTTLEQKDAELKQREAEIATKEAELAALNDQVTQLKESLQTQYNDMTELIKLFNGMDTKKAAAILEAYQDDTKVASVIRSMNARTASEVLTNMTPDFAAKILKLINP